MLRLWFVLQRPQGLWSNRAQGWKPKCFGCEKYEIWNKKKLLCVKNIVWFRFRTQIKPVRFHALIMVIIIIVEVEVVLYWSYGLQPYQQGCRTIFLRGNTACYESIAWSRMFMLSYTTRHRHGVALSTATIH